MEPVMAESLAPILQDLARAGIAPPTFDETDWMGEAEHASSMMWRGDGSGTGFSVRRADSLPDRIASAADQVQEWAIEGELWGRGSTNWPPCPQHPDNHPLRPTVVGSDAVWVCPADDSVVATIGGR